MSSLLSDREFAQLVEAIGEQAAILIERAVDRRVNAIWFARSAKVATAAVMGVAITKTTTGPNGTITLAAIWTGDETAQAAVWVPLRPGLTVAEGDTVRVERDHPTAKPMSWLVDCKV